MTLYKFYNSDLDNRNSAFIRNDIRGLDVYSGTSDNKVGSVHDVLVDEMGHIRYLVVDAGFWISGKTILLPFSRCRFGQKIDRVQAIGLISKEQLENIPDFSDEMAVDYDYEEKVRQAYRLERIAGLEKTSF